MPFNRRFIRLPIALAAASLCGLACGRSSARVDSPAAGGEVSGPNATTMVRGIVSDVTSRALVVRTDTGNVNIALVGPPKTFDREPGSLGDVGDNSFIGVTSVKQSDGTEQATEIHVFPEALRGLGEGSHMMQPGASPEASRMTNGNVQAPRMSNGTVSSSKGGTLVVAYAGGSQTINVPATTQVTVIKETSKRPAVGDQVVVMSTRARNGALNASSVLLVSK